MTRLPHRPANSNTPHQPPTTTTTPTTKPSSSSDPDAKAVGEGTEEMMDEGKSEVMEDGRGDDVDILILGMGWTSTFLVPLLEERGVSWKGTTRDGRGLAGRFCYEPGSEDLTPYERLPNARTILITFPLKGSDQSQELIGKYEFTHSNDRSEGFTLDHSKGQWHWIQLGSTGIFKAPVWNDESSPYDKSSLRAQAEDGLLSLVGQRACVLNLSGLYGGERQPKNWVTRVAKTRAEAKAKTCVHLVNGRDVARAILLSHQQFDHVGGKRWILTDLQCYDWWALFMMWGAYAREKILKEEREAGSVEEAEGEGEGRYEYEKWVLEAMEEENVKALPRDKELLGRKVDGRAFWSTVGSCPEIGRVV